MALENFDVVGLWREEYRALEETDNPRRPKLVKGKTVSVADKMPRHGNFESFAEFRNLLKKDEKLVYHNIAHKLATFGLGRKMNFADEQALQKVAYSAQKQNRGFRTIIHGLVASELFRKP